jgi:DNA-binding SARP family transcriptional activator
MVGGLPIIRSKVRVPAVADAVIPRGRVVAALEDAARGRRVLEVVASAGSGKTTAVVQFLARRPGPRAWLTLGDADGSPGRVVSYLAAAAGAVDPGEPARTAGMLARGASPADCAAMLAERLPPGTTLVLDDLHVVAARPPVLAVLRAAVEALPEGVLLVLVSRRPVAPDLGRVALAGGLATVAGGDLLFTVDEVRELLDARGVEASAEEVSAATGGWAAGIVFDAVRGGGGPPPGGPGEDPFFAYLGTEVLDALPADLRLAVVRSAVLETVDAAGLERVLLAGSGEALLARIRRHDLPATVEPEGVRYHPRFREFLLSRLREDRELWRVLLVRHARHLLAQGQAEEAAERFIAAGEPYEAQAAVEAATPAMLLRGDGETVLGWCAAIGEEALSRRASLRGCQIAATIVCRRREVPALVQALRRTGEFDRLVDENPDAAAAAVFGLHFSMSWASLMALLPADEASPRARATRYVLTVGAGRMPPREWDPRRMDAVPPNVGLLQCGLYFRGRFADAELLAELPGPDGGAPDLELYRIASMRERGRVAEARAAFDRAAPDAAVGGYGDFWRHLEGELVFAEGDREGGLALVREARAMTRAHGHQPADRAIFAATEGKMLVRLGRHEEAVDLLRATRAWCQEHGLPCFREWADTWLATALLAGGAPPCEAIDLLEEAISGMRTAGRTLELPAAWTALAEARWRAGDRAGHDAAAEAARAASLAMGTLEPLLTGLECHPEVAARRIAAGGPDAGEWRTLALAHDRAAAPANILGARVVVGTLGRPRLLVDGEEREVAPLRALEVAAAVARAGPGGVARAEIARGLSGESVDAGNYLRQIVHRLRRVLPEGVELRSDGGVLRWAPPGAVATEDQMVLALIARARREIGEGRRATLGAALAMAGRGPLWAQDGADAARRGRELAAAVADARRGHAGLLLDAGRAAEAVEAARAAVVDDPYREDGWRLLMRAGAAAAGPSAVLPVYLECAAVLEGVGLRPTGETRALLERLRGAASPPRGRLRVAHRRGR